MPHIELRAMNRAGGGRPARGEFQCWALFNPAYFSFCWAESQQVLPRVSGAIRRFAPVSSQDIAHDRSDSAAHDSHFTRLHRRREHGQSGLPLLFIHGNSSCRGVFRHQLHGGLAKRHRLIAFDLPGHGQSNNAPDATRSYTRSAVADAAVEILGKLDVTEAIVFGWYLGGHIGIEMVPRPVFLGYEA
jgi:pimeloyl-ACP methyl ester carboxylesterase